MPIALRAMRGCVASGFHLSLLTPAVPTVQLVFRESKRSAAMKLTRHRSPVGRAVTRGKFLPSWYQGGLTRAVHFLRISYSRGTHRAPPASSFFRICVSGDHPKLLGGASLADTAVGLGSLVRFRLVCGSQRAFHFGESGRDRLHETDSAPRDASSANSGREVVIRLWGKVARRKAEGGRREAFVLAG